MSPPPGFRFKAASACVIAGLLAVGFEPFWVGVDSFPAASIAWMS